jgi:hypothetical protein
MIKEKEFDQKIIDQIKNKKIWPRPRWLFLLKNYSIWLAGVLTLLFGSVSSALLIYLTAGNDFMAHRRIGFNLVEFLLLAIPFFWLIASAVLIYLAYINLKKTENGYRYSPWLIGSIVVIISLIGGFIFYNLGLSRTIDNILGRKVPFYEHVINPRIGFWMDNSCGRLAGIMVEYSLKKQQLILVDSQNNNWLVDVSRINQSPRFTMIDFNRLINQPIGLSGQVTAVDRFEAREIMPIRGGDGFFRRRRSSGGPPVKPMFIIRP